MFAHNSKNIRSKFYTLLLKCSWEFQNDAFWVRGTEQFDILAMICAVCIDVEQNWISVLWGPVFNSCVDFNFCLCIGLNFVGQYLCPLDDERDQGVDKTLNVMCNKIISSLAEKHEFISKKTCWRTIRKLVRVHPLITTFLPCSYKSATVYWCVFLDFEWLCNKNFVSMI